MTPWQLRRATDVIYQGGVIAYPTEAVFGLGCDPSSFEAVEKICRLKQRPLSKGLILIASSPKQLLPYCKLTAAQQQKILPGKKPVSWIVPVTDDCPLWLTGTHKGIAVRISKHPVVSALCDQADSALVSTSANISSKPAARTALKVQQVFGDLVDFIVHADTGGIKNPSEIRDIQSGKILRKG